MEKFSIDSKIYAGKLLDELNNLGLVQNLMDSEEINDEESFTEMQNV